MLISLGPHLKRQASARIRMQLVISHKRLGCKKPHVCLICDLWLSKFTYSANHNTQTAAEKTIPSQMFLAQYQISNFLPTDDAADDHHHHLALLLPQLFMLSV